MEMNTGRRPDAAEPVTCIIVNGERCEPSPGRSGTPLGLPRSGLGLTAAKPGCGEGECSARTVLVDGTPVLACQPTAAGVAGLRHRNRGAGGLAAASGPAGPR